MNSKVMIIQVRAVNERGAKINLTLYFVSYKETRATDFDDSTRSSRLNEGPTFF